MQWTVHLCLALLMIAVPRAAGAQLFMSPARVEADAAIEQATRLIKSGQHEKALVPAKRALELFESVNGKDHPNVALALDTLGQIHLIGRRFKEAEPLFKRAHMIATSASALGSNHAFTGQTLNNLGLTYFAMGRAGDAVQHLQRAINVYQAALGADHLEVGTASANLGMAYNSQVRYAEAEKALRRGLAIYEKALGPHHANVAFALDQLARAYVGNSRFKEAVPVLERWAAIVEKTAGSRHPDYGSALYRVGEAYREAARYEDAEKINLRALALFESLQGDHRTDIGIGYNNLGMVRWSRGNLQAAEDAIKRGLPLFDRKGGASADVVARALNNLGHIYTLQERFSEAEPMLRRAVALADKASGTAKNDVWAPLNNLAFLCIQLGRNAEAEAFVVRAIGLMERTLGAAHPKLVNPLNNLGLLRVNEMRFADAEPVLKRSIAILEKSLGRNHSDLATPVSNLALLYAMVGRISESQELWKRAIEIIRHSFGEIDARLSQMLNNIAVAYLAQDRLVEAREMLQSSADIYGKAANASQAAAALTRANLALVNFKLGDRVRAEADYRQAITMMEAALGRETADLATFLTGLAELLVSEGKIAEANELLQRGMRIRERVLGNESVAFSMSLDETASISFIRGDYSAAVENWRKSGVIIASHQARGTGNIARESMASGVNKQRSAFVGLARALHRLTPEGHSERPASAREAFVSAQRALSSSAAASLAQMAARSHSGDARLSGLVREQQDLIREWQALEKLQIEALSAAQDRRKASQEKSSEARMAGIDKRLKEIAAALEKQFPDYRALSHAAPLSVDEAQAELSDGEALVLFMDTNELAIVPGESFVWVVTKTDLRWKRLELGREQLSREVSALRCGLDLAAWNRTECTELTGDVYTAADREAGKPLRFDTARAHELYKALFSGVADLIDGRQLLLVPSGPLTKLPFQVLVKAAPEGTNYATARWLALDHAITVLPAASALKSLRRVSQPSKAMRPMLGFANPLLEGPQNDVHYGAYYKNLAAAAKATVGCARTQQMTSAALRHTRGSTASIPVQRGMTNLGDLKVQVPLPETADEICAVARDLDADLGEMRLGARATEREVKALSAGGKLAQYRLIHFATHAALAGELNGTAEPGLIMTPPAPKATQDDDGYLSGSEIASLKLDAEWVILSACNTAGSDDAGGGEALSGLARAFFYAGARALLASHWAVDTDATVQLVTVAARESRNKAVGRAEALRRAMLSMINNGKQREAHPTYWAPFVIIGEGGAGR